MTKSIFLRTKHWLQSYPGLVFQRIIAALLLAYPLANFAAAIFGFLLPTDKVNATLYATLLSFCFYTAAIMWVFSSSTNAQLWRQLLWSLLVTGLAATGLYQLESL